MRRNLEVVKTAKKYDKTTGEFQIDIRYKSKLVLTERTAAVAEAFGIGLDEEREHIVYDNLRLKVGPKDVVYISGESGSGKSVLLRAMEVDLGKEAANIDAVEVEGNKPIIDTVGGTFQEGLRLLSLVGLNDALLFLKLYPGLSEGQKYRYRLARLMEGPERFWLADEFCSALDRTTARIVAYNAQKQARRIGRCLIVATCHTDLFSDLAPSVQVRKGLGSRLEVDYSPNAVAGVCSVAEEVSIVRGSPRDYHQLSEFHYRSEALPPPIAIYSLKHSWETVGVIVYSYPGIKCFGRRRAAGRRVHVDELNKDWAAISRVVLHPRFRSIGLGQRLVKETLPLMGRRYVETLAVMARYNPFFERAGMEKVAESQPHGSVTDAIEEFKRLGFNPVTLASKGTNLRRLEEMIPEEVDEVKAVLLSITTLYFKLLKGSGKSYVRRDEFREYIEDVPLPRLARMLSIVAVLGQSKVYLFWRAQGTEDA